MRFEGGAVAARLQFLRVGAVLVGVVFDDPLEEVVCEPANGVAVARVSRDQAATDHAADMRVDIDQRDVVPLARSGNGRHDACRGAAVYNDVSPDLWGCRGAEV